MVLSRAAVRDMYDQDQAASMIGYVTMGMAVVPMIGPAMGGLLEESFGWKANFWLPFALGALTLAADLCRFRGNLSQKRQNICCSNFANTPSCSCLPGSGAIRSPRLCSSGAFFAYLGGAPFIGTEVFGMSAAEVGHLFRRTRVGLFFGELLQRAVFGQVRHQPHGALGMLVERRRRRLSAACFLWLRAQRSASSAS